MKAFLVLLLFVMLFSNCLNQDSERCLTAIAYYESEKFKLILEEKKKIGRNVTLIGVDPDSKGAVRYSNAVGFLYDNFEV